jgi:hypothetical protein
VGPLDASGGGRSWRRAASITDGFTGQAPDLGALEVGRPLPVWKRTGIVGGSIPREDVAHGTTIEVFTRAS